MQNVSSSTAFERFNVEFMKNFLSPEGKCRKTEREGSARESRNFCYM